MGWTWSNREPGMTTRAYFEREFSIGTPDARVEFLGTAMVGSTFYAAVRTIKTGEVWALVCLTGRQRGYFNFGYKDMDEGMGPNEAQMPAKLLDLLTDTESAYANEWRSRCRTNAYKATLARSLKRGDVIRLDRPLQFGNPDRLVFICEVLDARRGYFAAADPSRTRFQFSLGANWAAERDWDIIERSPVREES